MSKRHYAQPIASSREAGFTTSLVFLPDLWCSTQKVTQVRRWTNVDRIRQGTHLAGCSLYAKAPTGAADATHSKTMAARKSSARTLDKLMDNNLSKRPAAAVATIKRDNFRDWLIPPSTIPVLLILLAAAYGLYRMWA